MKEKPDSKAGRAREADRLLRRLLRAPRTRAGLIAAVTASGKVSRNFVYGWLSVNTVNGVVTVLKGAGRREMYQITAHIVAEVASEGTFPAWLEPRALPLAHSREVFIAGQKPRTTKD